MAQIGIRNSCKTVKLKNIPVGNLFMKNGSYYINTDMSLAMRKRILELTGVDIMIDGETFKSTYQIMLEVADKWSELSDVDRTALLEMNGITKRSCVVNLQSGIASYMSDDEIVIKINNSITLDE